jgi:pimeloyl-ACP methyl ester carboxylesterase
VHGGTADHSTTWRFVLPDLERHFAVYVMDRRGRGGSGDAAGYSLRREAEDVAAVVEAIGGPVDVLGHSFGALCSLEASLLTSQVRRLILYEGVPLRGADAHDLELLAHIEELGRAGDNEGVMLTVFREIVKMPEAELTLLRSQEDAWARRVANASALPRELRVEYDYVFRPERFGSMRTPTLLLVGGDSPPRELESATGVARALPDARVAVLPRQQHVAMYTAPQVFVEAVVRFLGAAPLSDIL